MQGSNRQNIPTVLSPQQNHKTKHISIFCQKGSQLFFPLLPLPAFFPVHKLRAMLYHMDQL